MKFLVMCSLMVFGLGLSACGHFKKCGGSHACCAEHKGEHKGEHDHKECCKEGECPMKK